VSVRFPGVPCPHHPHQSQRGFTLIELSIVLLVVGLLLGTILMPIATQYRIRETREAQKQIEEVRQALIGFAQSQRRLPCPDTDFDGLEDGAVPDCGYTAGYLPYATIGLPPTDPWGRLYAYRVAPLFTYTTVPGATCEATPPPPRTQLDLCAEGDIRVFTRDDNKNEIEFATNAAALIVSYGPNGYCGRRLDGTQVAPATGSCPTTALTNDPSDEFENSDLEDSNAAEDVDYVSRSYTNGGTNCDDTDSTKIFCEFDDLVVWIPTSLLLGKLIEAGQLP